MSIRKEANAPLSGILGLISQRISKLANTIIQLAQVPVFFHFWSEAVYGNWLLLNAIPTYLSFSNIAQALNTE